MIKVTVVLHTSIVLEGTVVLPTNAGSHENLRIPPEYLISTLIEKEVVGLPKFSLNV